MTVGKKLGLVAFVISEIMVFSYFVLSVIAVFFNLSFEIDIYQLLLFQGTIFIGTWGAKASKNFVKNN